MVKNFICLLVTYSCLFSPLYADYNVTAYFSNDSVNGFKVSDAYETHNMGMGLATENKFVSLDLGIVSPDMHLYKNEYREANRSFGELISISIGRNDAELGKWRGKYFSKITASGEFGIDRLQDVMHKILNLQPVNHVNDLVRMPNNVWIGFGVNAARDISEKDLFFDTGHLNVYLGNDRMEISGAAKKTKYFDDFSVDGIFGLRAIPYDNIVSALPISAGHREIIPYVALRLNFNYLGAKFFVEDKFALPTVSDDSSIYGLLTAGVSIDWPK